MIPRCYIEEENIGIDSKSTSNKHHQQEERAAQLHKFGADFRPFVSYEKTDEYWDDKGNKRNEQLKVRQFYGFVCIQNVFAE